VSVAQALPLFSETWVIDGTTTFSASSPCRLVSRLDRIEYANRRVFAILKHLYGVVITNFYEPSVLADYYSSD
jgi:hypothetical protein